MGGRALLGSGIIVTGGRADHPVADHNHSHDGGDDEHDATRRDYNDSHHVHSQTLTQVPGTHRALNCQM